MERSILAFLVSLFIVLLCSCTTCHPPACDEDRIAICKELKSKMIFKGNTSNTRTSEIENSEMAMLQRQYERYNCDRYCF